MGSPPVGLRSTPSFDPESRIVRRKQEIADRRCRNCHRSGDRQRDDTSVLLLPYEPKGSSEGAVDRHCFQNEAAELTGRMAAKFGILEGRPDQPVANRESLVEAVLEEQAHHAELRFRRERKGVRVIVGNIAGQVEVELEARDILRALEPPGRVGPGKDAGLRLLACCRAISQGSCEKSGSRPG